MRQKDPGVFASLGRGRVSQILKVLDRGMARDPLYDYRVKDLKKIGLTEEQAGDIIGWFYDFYIGATNPALMMKMLRSVEADAGAKENMIDAFKRVERDANWPRPADYAEDGGHPRDRNLDEFDKFVYLHKDDPEVSGKYVAFVHGKYQKCGASQNDLIREMNEKFGDVDMIVGKVTARPDTTVMHTPELI